MSHFDGVMNFFEHEAQVYGDASADESDSHDSDSDSSFLDSDSVEESYTDRLQALFDDSDTELSSSESSCEKPNTSKLTVTETKKKPDQSQSKLSKPIKLLNTSISTTASNNDDSGCNNTKKRKPKTTLSSTSMKKASKETFEPPGSERYPLTEWSLTVTRTGEDVHTSALDTIYSFYTAHCTKGGVSTEVGSRAHRFHLQGVFQTKFPTDDKAKKYLCTFIRNLLPKASGYRVLAKKLMPAQNFNTMCGYILKDEGQPWFQCRIHNISRNELEVGRFQHIAQLTSFDENKIILTHRNLIAELFKFQMRCLYPCVAPLRYCALYALQSGNYAPSPEWLRKYAKMETQEAEALWALLFAPKKATLADVDDIFFDSRNMTSFHRVRYFVTGHNGSVANQPEPPVNDGSTKLSRIMSLIRTAKEERGDVRNEGHTAELDDFVHVPSQDSSFKILNETAIEDFPCYNCPDTIEEMLLIVSKHRRNRLDIITSVNVAAAMSSTVDRGNNSQAMCSDAMPSVDLSLLPFLK